MAHIADLTYLVAMNRSEMLCEVVPCPPQLSYCGGPCKGMALKSQENERLSRIE